jgi:transposase|tara:strand:- start:64181 stop:64363 length:183 start_codon:yes stop_codon:yes gene_type:complete
MTVKPKQENSKASIERVVNDVRRAIRKQHSVKDQIRIMLKGLRSQDSFAELCRREDIAPG